MSHSAARRALALVSALALLIFGALPAFADSFDLSVDVEYTDYTWYDLAYPSRLASSTDIVSIPGDRRSIFVRIPNISYHGITDANYTVIFAAGSYTGSSTTSQNLVGFQYAKASQTWTIIRTYSSVVTYIDYIDGFYVYQVSDNSNFEFDTFYSLANYNLNNKISVGVSTTYSNHIVSNDFADSVHYQLYPYTDLPGNFYGLYDLKITTDYLYNFVDFYSYDVLNPGWYDDLSEFYVSTDSIDINTDTDSQILTLTAESLDTASTTINLPQTIQLHRYRFKNVPKGTYTITGYVAFNHTLPGSGSDTNDMIFPAIVVIDNTTDGIKEAWKQIVNDYVDEDITLDEALDQISSLLDLSLSVSETCCDRLYWISYADYIQDRITSSETYRIYQLISAALDQIAADVETIRTSDASLAASLDARLASILAALGSSGSSQTQILQTVNAINAELTTVDPEDREAVEDLREKMDEIRDQIAETSPAESALESRISAVTVPEFDMTSVKTQISDVGDLAEGLGSITQSIFTLPKIGIVLLLGGVAFYVRKIMKHASK